MPVFELRPSVSVDVKDLEKDRTYQEELTGYLERLDEAEALRESDAVQHLASLSLEQTKTVTAQAVARIMFDACTEDMQRRGVGDERTVQALNNYLQYAKSGNIVKEKPAGIAVAHVYRSAESQTLEQKILEQKMKLLSGILGDERGLIDDLHTHLDQWWNDETTQERMRVSEKNAMEALQTRGPHEFLAAAEMVAKMSTEKPAPGEPVSLAALREQLATKRKLTDAREAMEMTLRGEADAFGIVGNRGAYTEGMAEAARRRKEDGLLSRARVRIQAIRGECINYLRRKNLRLEKI